MNADNDETGVPQASGQRRREGRSPKNPGIDLEQAFERARTLYDAEGRHPAPVPTILEHWGYSPKSSGGFSTLAALKQYGLLEDEGGGQRRQAKLTPLALSVLLDESDDSGARERRIREAALTPDINRELWEMYGPRLPSDNNLRTHLRTDRGFTESGARAFLPVFRDTIEFARLREAEESSVDAEAGDKAAVSGAVPGPEPSDVSRATMSRNETGTQIFHIPVAPGRTVALHGSFPLSDADWRQMMAVLEAMKPALTKPATAEPGETS